ncbi:hypothetical protein [Ralstonia wenshanensis]|uniref:hypothetical protein n=1 Tax=Ralstonia wenshanensis TaxID=2842456 RepID=UPI003D98F867
MPSADDVPPTVLQASRPAWNEGSLPDLYQRNFGPGLQNTFYRNNGEYVDERDVPTGPLTEFNDAPKIPEQLLPRGGEQLIAWKDDAGGVWYGIQHPDAPQGAGIYNADMFTARAQATVAWGTGGLDSGNITPSQYADAVRFLRESGAPLEAPSDQSVTAGPDASPPADVAQENGSPSGVGGFQAANDAKVYAGSYDRFQEIGNALRGGQFGEAWQHLNFEASPDAQSVNHARLFPAPSPTAARFEQMLASPVGTSLSEVANILGASQHTQDALLGTGAFAENLFGGMAGFGGNRAQGPGQFASIRRGQGQDPDVSLGEAAQAAAASRPANTTRLGVTRTNAADWRALRAHWDDLGYGEILSPTNRAAISRGRTPTVDESWVNVFPEDAGLLGERITMHHIQGLPVTVPLPTTRHMDAHMPGGFRYNPGGPGSALPFYPAEPGN